MEALTFAHWSLLALGALIMGMSKGGIPGAGNLTVAIFALVLEDALGPVGVPLSVGLLLPVLISADVRQLVFIVGMPIGSILFAYSPVF